MYILNIIYDDIYICINVMTRTTEKRCLQVHANPRNQNLDDHQEKDIIYFDRRVSCQECMFSWSRTVCLACLLKKNIDELKGPKVLTHSFCMDTSKYMPHTCIHT